MSSQRIYFDQSCTWCKHIKIEWNTYEEVEKLRSKSDTKTKILSLDSELRIQSLKLAEFEEKAGNRQRLVTKKKKLNSSSLLQERFRKQMQNNFSSKLHKLVELLQEWQALEGCKFNAKLLSVDVNAFLIDPDNRGDWIEKRTAFMHLKTVKQKTRRRAVVATINSSSSPKSIKTVTNSISSDKAKSQSKCLRQTIPLLTLPAVVTNWCNSLL